MKVCIKSKGGVASCDFCRDFASDNCFWDVDNFLNQFDFCNLGICFEQ